MLKDKLKKIDTWIIILGLLYIIVPIIIFLLEFTRPGFFVIGLVLFAYLIYRVLVEIDILSGFSNSEIVNRKTLVFLIATTAVFCVWLYFSGIGSFSFQNWDFWVRNPIYNDLINKSWPMYYDLSTQSEFVRGLIGGEWVAFAYYFTYWLLPAGFCKVMHFSGTADQVILFLYSLLGIIIVHFLLCRYFKKFSWKITAVTMTFSGLDVVAYILKNLKLPALTQELEWSLIYYQLSGNTTQLYYVFNQSIPIWIIMLLILNVGSPKLMAAIGSVCFAYSPWATIGLVPVVVVGMLCKPDRCKFADDIDNRNVADTGNGIAGRIKCCLSISNILIPVFMLVVFGLYYTASGGSDGGKGLYYFTTGASVSEYVLWYVVFVLTEFGLYYIAMGKRVFKYGYSVVVLAELILFPLFYIVDFNFFIRGTIPALFLLMVIIISFIYSPDDKDVRSRISFSMRKRILAVLLVIGAMTSVIAFTRSVIYTAKGGDILEDDIASFDDMSEANDYQVLTVNSQFFVHGFASKPFYLYISKRGL